MLTPRCPKPSCSSKDSRPHVVRRGRFKRKEDGSLIQRFQCQSCGRSFSSATLKDCYNQKKRRINGRLLWILNSKVSQRRAALIEKVNVKTIARRTRFFGMVGRKYLHNLRENIRGLDHAMFDEMQTSEHSKCKPIAIPMVTCPKTRMILAVGVASMPAQHPLVEISLRKYGPRIDERPEAIVQVLEAIKFMLKPGAILTTDMSPLYPEPIAMVLPHVRHDWHKSRKARSGGQGELKKIGFDPLFNFNHTAAMTRDGLGCMVRKTWGNTKLKERLYDRVAMYAYFHNEIYLPTKAKKRG